MTLTPISLRESARKNFLLTRRTSCLESGNQTFLGSGRWNDSNTHQFAQIGEKKLSSTRGTSCLESGNQTFLDSLGRNDSNTYQFAPIGEKKIFMNSTYIMSRKVESNLFRAQEAEMTLTPISSLESARKNFSWTRRTSCLESGNQTFLGSVGRIDYNTHQFARISEKKIFYELDVHHV